MSLQVLQDEESHQVTVLEDAAGDVEGEGAEGAVAASHKHVVTYKFRDSNSKMVAAWQEHFQDHKPRIEISHGDIFEDAPSADALVSPANSFGFMDGGIDMVYSLHFGWQMQKRLQEIIRNEKHGELLVSSDTMKMHKEKISSVLIPGLGTAIGQMPGAVCAFQMLQAYETFELGLNASLISPEELYDISKHHQMMSNPLYFNS